jgi:crotonobetainyl-CoA:carnitine CoA-transferase CaiB-like acyl-CoA transferase
MTMGVLSHVRVLDFGRYIAGPYCAAVLADLGAEVIRIERPGGNDDRYVMPVTPEGEGALHIQVNRNKKSLALDLSAPEARGIVERLIASADVIVANLPPLARAKLGLDYETVSRIRPDIILCTVSAFGTRGADANTIGFDGTGQALSGAMYLTGVEGQPYRSAVSYVDYSTAMASALGVLAALMRRDRTGKGEHVETSLLNTALTMTNTMLIEEATGARSRKPTGNRTPIAAPSDVFRTADGWILVQVIGQEMFERWIRLVGAEELRGDPRFADDMSRGDHGEFLSRRTEEWTRQYTTERCLELLKEARVPGCRVLSPKESLQHPQVAQSGLLDWIQFPGLEGEVPLLGSLFTFAGQSAGKPAASPRLGADTRHLLESIGYTPDRIETMMGAGIVAVA